MWAAVLCSAVNSVISSNYMKKFLLLVFAAAVAASCLKNSQYTESYPIVTYFDYEKSVYDKEFGADSTCYGNGGGFLWADLAFHNKVSADGSFKGGFLLSYLEAPGFGAKDKEYVVNPDRVAGKPLANENTYAVFHAGSEMPERDITFLIDPKYGVCEIDHCYINNTEEVYEASKSFETGDKLVLTVRGYLNGIETGSVNLNLATPDTTIYNWTKLDLKKLGTIDAIDFDLYASRSGIPASFCLDELNAMVNIAY